MKQGLQRLRGLQSHVLHSLCLIPRSALLVYFDTRGQPPVLASRIEPYFSLQIHANPSWLTVYRHRKCAVTQLHSTAVNTTI